VETCPRCGAQDSTPRAETKVISTGKAIAYATVTRLHLSVHSTAALSRRQAGQPVSSAECLMHSAARASQRAAPCPAAPFPDVNVDVGASAHANRAICSC